MISSHGSRCITNSFSPASRDFTDHFGMTSHEFHRANRLELAMNDVRNGSDLLKVGFDHGFDSDSGFRNAFGRLFGITSGRVRDADCLFAKRLDTPLGLMLGVANENGVCMLEFVDRRSMETQVATLKKHFPHSVVPGSNAMLDMLSNELDRYFAGILTEFTVPLIHPGTPFQLAVWDVLKTIPFGGTTSYGAIAEKIGRAGASQAVGRANGDNRLAILLPCHRVVRSDGHLCGYAGGLRRKQWLFDHERRVSGRFVSLFEKFVDHG